MTERSAAAAQSNHRHAEQIGSEPAGSGKRYLCWFLHRYLDFRNHDLQAAARLAGCAPTAVTLERPYGGAEHSPFWYVHVPSEDIVTKIAERCLLTKVFIELWGEGDAFADMAASMAHTPAEVMQPYLGPDRTFKVRVDSWGKKISEPEQLKWIHELEFIDFQGTVSLNKPQEVFWLIFAADRQENGMPAGEVPTRVYFGRQVAAPDRSRVRHYALPSRAYLGPTSMDAELAFIMCNSAGVAAGHLVFDPYVGTGSILVGAAHHGARVLGGDIDARVILDGKVGEGGERLDIYANFAQYGLPPPLGLIRMDAHCHPFREEVEEVFDAIMGDPPYGVRAGARKSAPREVMRAITNRDRHVPVTANYTLGECLRDLLDLSARLLRQGGRLVYWMPATPETYREEEIPRHPSLQLVSNCEQMLTSRYSRRLITMEKVCKYDAAEARAFHEAQGEPIMAIDRVSEQVFTCLRDGRGKPILPDHMNAKPKFRSKRT